MTQVKIEDITEKNFQDIPRPANQRFNCQECFYWVGKKDGRTDLVKQKKNWFVRKGKKHDGSLGKILYWGKRRKPVGFIQFGPISEFPTTNIVYKERCPAPKNGWCITCVAIQSAYRGKGLAMRLIRNALRDMKRRGAKTVDAYPLKKARSWNQVSVGPVALWEKCGFKKVGEVKPEKGTPTLCGNQEEVLVRKKW